MIRLGRLLIVPAALFVAVLAGFAMALAGAAALTRLLVRRAERRYPRPAGAVVVDGVELRYTEAGTGTPVVLVHGLLGSTYDFGPALTGRLARHHRVVALDRPGNGYSEAPPVAGHTPIGQATCSTKPSAGSASSDRCSSATRSAPPSPSPTPSSTPPTWPP